MFWKYQAISIYIVPFIFLSTLAWGHGGGNIEEDTCVLRVGPFLMHFSGYQPETRAGEELCKDIPDLSKTIIVFDYIDQKLRSLKTSVRIVEDAEGRPDKNSESLETKTLLYLPPKVYPSGTVSMTTTFDKPGKYIGIITVESDQKYISRFPFSVGMTPYGKYIKYFLAIAAVGFILYFLARYKKSPVSKI